MPRFLFYAGTVFCLLLSLASGLEAIREVSRDSLAFVAIPGGKGATWAIVSALLAGIAIATMFLRMAALLAARNLFAAFVAIVCVAGAITTLAGVLFLQWRLAAEPTKGVEEIHFAALMAFGFFVSMSLLSLRPYFSIQASRLLSALVFFPLPLFCLMLAHEVIVGASKPPVPASSPASQVFFSVLAILFFSIAVHCIRHRHLFLEMTNLRELLDTRVDPTSRPPRRTLGGVAFDS
ncbi:MAG: hypothetical protein WA208_20220 [Thermoanaerobaculia bacterium]